MSPKKKNEEKEIIPAKVHTGLKNLGFTEYYLNIFVGLLNHGEKNARELSTITEVPYSRIYEVLNEMAEKGIIFKIEGRPSTYVANDPQDVFKIIQKTQENQFSQNLTDTLPFLNDIYGDKKVKNVKLNFYTEKTAYDHIRKSINAAMKTICIKISNIDSVMDKVQVNLEFAYSKGVKIRFILSETQKDSDSSKTLSKFGDVKYLNTIFEDLIIYDDIMAMQGIHGKFNLIKPKEKVFQLFSTPESDFITYVQEKFDQIWESI